MIGLRGKPDAAKNQLYRNVLLVAATSHREYAGLTDMETKSFNTIKGVVDCLNLPRDVREPAVVVGFPIERAGTERFSSCFEVGFQLNSHAARQLAHELLKCADEAESIRPLE